LPDGGVEQCDNSSRDAGACPYGTPTCQACGTDCRDRTLTGSYCGDHVQDPLPDGGTETCDDLTTGWTACPYGTPSCTSCMADCSGTQPLTGPYCGDGVRTNPPEACDDGNNDACGTCSADCRTSQPFASASGSITTVQASNIPDGDTVTLNDGVHAAEVFEFDKDNAVATGHIRVAISGNSSSVADSVRTAITTENTAGRLTIAPGGTGNTVALTNTQPGTVGNQLIQTTVNVSGFSVTGMSGGRAFDCPADTGCKTNSDCALGLNCLPNLDGGTSLTCQ
jgi:cysteine-rich repeat protein